MLILGDSLSAGYGIPSEKQWVKLVQQKLDTDSKKLKLINASLSGETTKGGLSRLPSLFLPNWWLYPITNLLTPILSTRMPLTKSTLVILEKSFVNG